MIDIIHALDGLCNFVVFFSFIGYLLLKIKGYEIIVTKKRPKFLLIAAFLGVLFIPSKETLIKLLG
ncbi:hypothetical protein [Neisseria shayeganii]|uniref:Uncharacterized protein n=1 Tax=Neisseria shayeganii TaxID=607712 RepID=A0A7D7S8Z4_9NEIS|nr:hypothetical protein [Neisseria shayeganii]QMT41268.1 hypothetical protein H3L94_04370 [Neisseria shayeganii]